MEETYVDASVKHLKDQLTPEQHLIFEKVMLAVENATSSTKRLYAINGLAGTGKTFILRAIIEECIERDIDFCAMAYTNTSVQALSQRGFGNTFHSAFIIEPGAFLQAISNIESSPWKMELAMRSKIIMMDLINYCPKSIFEEIDNKLKELMKCKEPFGGKLVLIAGDSRGLHPIVDGNRSKHSVYETSLASNFDVMILNESLRHAGDPGFAAFLNEYSRDSSNVSLRSLDFVDSLSKLIDHTFGNVIDFDKLKKIKNRKILVGYNDDKEAVIQECIAKKRQGSKVKNIVYTECEHKISVEFINGFILSLYRDDFVQTIDNAQGETIEYVGLYAPNDLHNGKRKRYTAISRVACKENLRICGKLDERIKLDLCFC